MIGKEVTAKLGKHFIISDLDNVHVFFLRTQIVIKWFLCLSLCTIVTVHTCLMVMFLELLMSNRKTPRPSCEAQANSEQH